MAELESLTVTALGHAPRKGICRRCGCSAEMIVHFNWSCPPNAAATASVTRVEITKPQMSIEMELEEANTEIIRLKVTLARIVSRYDREGGIAADPAIAANLAWAMQSDAREGLEEGSGR